MKRRIVLLIAVIALVLLIATLITACNQEEAWMKTPTPEVCKFKLMESSQSGESDYYIVEEIIGEPKYVVIPGEYNGLPVKHVLCTAFTNGASIKGIVFQEGITGVLGGGFEPCPNLETIKLPSSFSSIRGDDFRCCANLSKIIVADGSPWYYSKGNCLIQRTDKTGDHDRLVVGCANSKIPNGIFIIGSFAFYGRSGLKKITIPNSVIQIEDWAFYGCNNLKKVVLSNKLGCFGNSAFEGCSALTKIVIPECAFWMMSNVFAGCDKLTIYCEAKEPGEWFLPGWNGSCPVVWGYKK